MDEIKIDIGVPIPITNTKYPFPKMEVGDSFFIALKDNKAKSIQVLQVNILSMAHRWAKKENNGARFITKKDHRYHGVRCWRVK